MSIFKNHKIGILDIIREIPEASLTQLAQSSKVDYCSKVLSGKLMFYLLLYGMLRIDRLSQRGLRDAFSSPIFRAIFHYKGKKEISHSSISERLSVIKVTFFQHSYECIYKRFSSLFTQKEIAGMCLQRVDSTLVKDSSHQLKEWLNWNNGDKKGKMLKYTINFDGMFASLVSHHTQPHYNSENLALPENVMNHFKREKDHAQVYVFDRGQGSAVAFASMKQVEGLQFVGRLQENRKMNIVESFDCKNVPFEYGELKSDSLVQLYKSVETITQNGKISMKMMLMDDVFRVIRFQPKNKEKEMILITNLLEVAANDIAGMYRRRWDIEVFFRFIKQELNFSHFLSLNPNGIQTVLYMTMITAMLVMIYKKENAIGYKTAVRRMGIELESLVMAIIVIQSGGDLSKTDLPDP